jgi:1-acyl-sn-glycerol-3-phosphate acyltransferase
MPIGSRKTGLIATSYGIWFGLVFVVSSLITVLLLTFVPGELRRRQIARNAAKAIFLLTDSRPQISGLEHLPKQPSVAVANHASYLDGILLTAVLPHQYSFVIKREMTRVPVAHFLLRRIGAHFVERNDSTKGASDIRRIMQTATGGGSLAFFPEGTFVAEPGIGRFRAGAFAVAFRENLPLVPITLNGTRQMLPAGRLLPAPARLAVQIHKAFHTDGDTNVEAAIAYCRGEIVATAGEPDRHSSE